MADQSHLPVPVLPQGWTEHVAPTGHTYFHNAETKKSTYKRPTNAVLTVPTHTRLPHHWQTPTPYLQLSDPRVANAFIFQNSEVGHGSHNSSKHDVWWSRPERKVSRQPTDKPVSKIVIPGHEPWILVLTKLGRRFVHNPEKNMSYWQIPDKLKHAVLDLDRARILKTQGSTTVSYLLSDENHDDNCPEGAPISKNADPDRSPSVEGKVPLQSQSAVDKAVYADSEYEEVEVSDDGEDEESNAHENPSKRQKTQNCGGLTEFGEEDIAFQLQATADSFRESDVHGAWGAAEDNGDLPSDDASTMFKALLDDFAINPYSSWEKLIEEGKIIEDPRYTLLTTMKARKITWEEWSRTKIRELRDRKINEEKKDPLLPYLSFLQKYASPRLFWPEFKRKYRREAEFRNSSLSEKDKEKWYRDFVNRLKLPQATLKSDFTKLLNTMSHFDMKEGVLPRRITTDIRYVCLDAKVREPLVKAYFQTGYPKAI